jgi:hypothetical protein
MKIIKKIGEIIAIIFGLLTFWVIMCISTHQVCGSDAKGICSFMCDDDNGGEDG